MAVSKKLNDSLVTLLVILGCIAVVFSIILPFYQIHDADHAAHILNTYWSFKCESIGSIGSTSRDNMTPRDYSLFHYWFGNIGIAAPFWPPGSFNSNIAFAPIGTFALQVLALALGLALIRFRKRILVTTLFCLSLVILFVMTYAGTELSHVWTGGGYIPAGVLARFPFMRLVSRCFLTDQTWQK